jgi:hypothetical protein
MESTMAYSSVTLFNNRIHILNGHNIGFSPDAPPSSNTKTGRHGNISDSDVKYQNSNSKFKFFKFSDEPILYIVAIEDMYPIIKQSHTAVGHGGGIGNVTPTYNHCLKLIDNQLSQLVLLN